MKLSAKLICFVLGGFLGGQLVSCTNELNEFQNNQNLNKVNLVKAPEIVAWSGTQKLVAGQSISTRYADTDAKFWANDYDIPEVLTASQKNIVRQYFQSVKNPGSTSLDYSNFFIQQVYKGGTNPGSNSQESYQAADGKTIGCSQGNMNQLYAGSDFVNNFSNGSLATNNEVWDGTLNGPDANNDKNYHSDAIMLMRSSSSSSFGYQNTADSKTHDDKYAIVSGSAIEAWAAANGLSCSPSISGRYFVGFDFAMLPENEVRTGRYWEYRGIQYEYLYSNLNMYCGETIYVNESNQIMNALAHPEGFTEQQLNGQYKEGIEKVLELINQGYLPVENTNYWAKYKDCADGYYSDLIICVTKAYPKGTTPEVTDPDPDPTPTPTPTPDQDDPTEDVEDPVKHNSEVEVNYEIMDSHDAGEHAYEFADLITKLSIHVRHATDVSIRIPVPASYIIESDDLYIFNQHYDGVYGGVNLDEVLADNTGHSVSYEIAGQTVSLTVSFYEEYITVSTSGINDAVLAYCEETYGDGINFEVFNYYQTEKKENDEVVGTGLTRENLKECLDRSKITFTNNPDYYINAFGWDYVDGTNGQEHYDIINPDDCTVAPESSEYNGYDEGWHLNGTPYNRIYVKSGVEADPGHPAPDNPDAGSSDNNTDNSNPDEEIEAE